MVTVEKVEGRIYDNVQKNTENKMLLWGLISLVMGALTIKNRLFAIPGFFGLMNFAKKAQKLNVLKSSPNQKRIE